MRVLGLYQAVALRSSCFYCYHSDVDGYVAGHGKRASAFSILMRREFPFAAIGEVVLQVSFLCRSGLLSCCSLQPLSLSRAQPESLGAK